MLNLDFGAIRKDGKGIGFVKHGRIEISAISSTHRRHQMFMTRARERSRNQSGVGPTSEQYVGLTGYDEQEWSTEWEVSEWNGSESGGQWVTEIGAGGLNMSLVIRCKVT